MWLSPIQSHLFGSLNQDWELEGEDDEMSDSELAQRLVDSLGSTRALSLPSAHASASECRFERLVISSLNASLLSVSQYERFDEMLNEDHYTSFCFVQELSKGSANSDELTYEFMPSGNAFISPHRAVPIRMLEFLRISTG